MWTHAKQPFDGPHWEAREASIGWWRTAKELQAIYDALMSRLIAIDGQMELMMNARGRQTGRTATTKGMVIPYSTHAAQVRVIVF